MNYYEMLNIEKNASKDEIVQAFRKTIKKCHPDRVKDADEKEKAEAMFQKLTEAFNILKDDEKRKEYDDKLDSGDDENKKELDLASQYFKNGLHQLNNEENFRLAEEFFRKAVYIDKVNAKYYYYLGKSQMEDEKKQRDAVKNIEEAIKYDPFQAKYPALIGEIYLKSGMNTRAIGYFKKALALDENNNEAISGLKALGIGVKQSFWSKLFNRK